MVLGGSHRALAREVAQRSMVLVRNEGALLPVDPGDLQRVAVVGRLAAQPNLGDGGSSDVHPTEVVTPLDGLRAGLAGVEVVHAADDPSVADGADLVVVVVGLTKADEGEYLEGTTAPSLAPLFPPADDPVVGAEAPLPTFTRYPSPAPTDERMAPGGDRRTLRLHAGDEALIEAVAARNPNTVVVVMGGSAVVMPWIDSVPVTVLAWYPGMEGGHALADVMTGRAEPGGRLPFAIPTDETHLAAFDPDATTAVYDLFHGQWLLDRDEREPAFPFGSGLTYTDFEIIDADVAWAAGDRGDDEWSVEATVANVGPRAGSTVVQVYAGLPLSHHERPHRRLVGFTRVALDPGHEGRVVLRCPIDPLRVRDGGAWVTEPGRYHLDVGLQANDPDRIELTIDR